MESEIEDRRMSEARAFGSHVALHALHHLQEIAGPAGITLLRHKIINKPPTNEDPYVLQIIADGQHPDRLAIPPGPIVAHYVRGKKTEVTCIPTPLLLLSSEKNARAGSLQHLVSIVRSIDHLKPEDL